MPKKPRPSGPVAGVRNPRPSQKADKLKAEKINSALKAVPEDDVDVVVSAESNEEAQEVNTNSGAVTTRLDPEQVRYASI
jgi:hypothetical protein